MTLTMVCTIVGRLDYAHEVGQIVSTCGLIDSAGDLIAYKNFSPKAKDADTRFEVQWRGTIAKVHAIEQAFL